jgi:hypothetical protein
MRAGSSRRRQTVAGWARKLVWVAIPVVVVGEAGHHLLERMGQAVAHHLFHILFAGGAALLFGIYVAVDIRRHGWPRFSWRLRTEPPPGPADPGP